MVRSLRVDGDSGSRQVVEEIIGDLRRIIVEAEDLGADMGRIAAVQEYNMRNNPSLLGRAGITSPASGQVMH